MKTRTTKVINGTLTSVLQYFVVMLLQFFLIPIIISFGSEEILGIYSYLLQLIGWAALSDMGFGVSASRYLAQSQNICDNYKKFTEVFNNSRSFYLLSNLIFSSIILILSFYVEDLIDLKENLHDTKISMYLFSVWIIIRTPLMLFGEALNATQNLSSNNYILIISSIIRLVSSVIFVYLGYGIIGLVFAYILGEFSASLLQKIKFQKLYHLTFSWGIKNKSLFKEIFYFGLTYMLISISSKIATSSDSLIIGSTLGAKATSMLYVTTMPAMLIFQLIWKLSDNSSPGLNDLYSINKLETIKITYLRICKISLILGFGLISGLYFFNEVFVNFWTGKMLFAGNTFNILFAIFCVFQILNHINFLLLVVNGEIKKLSIITFSLTIFKVVFCVFFLEEIGLYGIMISNLIVDVPTFIVTQYMIKKSFSVSFTEYLKNVLLSPLLILVIMVLTSFININYIGLTSLSNLILSILIFITIFFILSYTIGLNLVEKSYILKLIPVINKKNESNSSPK